MTIGQRLQSIPKQAIYLVLLLCATIPLFRDDKLPNVPLDGSIDFYGNLMSLKPGDRILIQSDWTNSTRGESGGEMQALLRILMRKRVKFVLFSIGDAQSPQVARTQIALIADEEAAAGRYKYQPFEDYVVAGYFPSGEGTMTAISGSPLKLFAGVKEIPVGGVATDVLRSPVFLGIRTAEDFKYIVALVSSSTNRTTMERVKNIPIMLMVTGVMVPENQNLYSSGQVKGLVGGVKGVFDLETLMESGLNGPSPIRTDHFDEIPAFKGMKNEGMGTKYYPTLHVCLALLILAVVVGNVGMVLSRREAKRR